MQQGIQYNHSYTPFVSLKSVGMLLLMTAVHNWHTKKLDHVVVFPQAPVEKELYMKISKRVNF